MTAVLEDVAITELTKIDAERVDGVGTPANGIPFLLMKSVDLQPEVETAAKGARDCPKCDKSFDADHQGDECTNCGAKLPPVPDGAEKSLPDWHAKATALVKKAMSRGKVDEQPDIDGGTQAIALLGKLIGYEAQELAAGHLEEVGDIQMLSDAASLVTAWLSVERAAQMGNTDAASMALAQSAAVTKEKHNAADRKKLAEQGNALSDGSYPIADEDDLKSAAILAQSGHGDVTSAKKLISRRSKELGVKNPLQANDDTSKSAIAPEGASVDTVAQGNDESLAKALESAVTKAMAPLQERIETLNAELAKVKAQPIPGGPMMSVARQSVKADDGTDWAAKAADFRAIADSLGSDPHAADGYRQLARQYEDKAKS